MRPLTFAFLQNLNTTPILGPQVSYPIGQGTVVWTVGAGVGQLFQQIDEYPADDDTTMIWSAKQTAAQEQDITMQALQEPDDHTQTKLYVRYKRRGATTAGQTFRVYLDGVLLGSKSIPNDLDYHDWTITLTAAQSAAINWTNTMTVTLRKETSTYTRGVRVSSMRLTTEQ